jgi:hypothetical protein
MKGNKKLIRFKNDVSKEFLEWTDLQSNLTEAITYLIEKEIFENGLRDLVNFIPIRRTDEYFESFLGKEKNEFVTGEVNTQKKSTEVEKAPPKQTKSILDDLKGYE